MNKEIVRHSPEKLHRISRLRSVLIGLPSSGKTTFVDSLKKVSPVNYLSLGAITRAELQKDTELAAKLKSLFRDSEPWPDEFVMSILEPYLLTSGSSGFMLGGIPKKLSEAKAMVAKFSQMGIGLDCIVTLEVSKNKAMQRITARDNSGRMGQVAHYETRFSGWSKDKDAILSELSQLTSNVKIIDTDILSVEEVLSEGLDFLVSSSKGL